MQNKRQRCLRYSSRCVEFRSSNFIHICFFSPPLSISAVIIVLLSGNFSPSIVDSAVKRLFFFSKEELSFVLLRALPPRWYTENCVSSLLRWLKERVVGGRTEFPRSNPRYTPRADPWHFWTLISQPHASRLAVDALWSLPYRGQCISNIRFE